MKIYNFNGDVYTPTKEISILFVGNSLTQDGIMYVPYILKQYFPEIDFKFYVWYNGGYTLAQQYNKFSNNQPCEIFSVCENGSSWINYSNSVTMRDVLTNYSFNVVCMQEYFTSTANTNYTVNDLVHWNNCADYITNNYNKNPLEFVTFAHAPRRNAIETIFNNMLQGLSIILKNTQAIDIVPNGFATKLALNTVLDELGDNGHLSPDGTHLQEGLPCLIESYCFIAWLFDKLGVAKSIYDCSLRVTTAIYNSINVAGANLGSGVITGTNEQNVLAQKESLLGYKYGKKFVIDNLA